MHVAPSETFSQIGGAASQQTHVGLRKLSSEDKAQLLENVYYALESVLSVSKEPVTPDNGTVGQNSKLEGIK